jgi:hypothetical protein
MYTIKVLNASSRKFVDTLSINNFESLDELKQSLNVVFGFVVVWATPWFKFILDGARKYERTVYVTKEA